MAVIYLDSSAYVKLYVAEAHSSTVQKQVGQASAVACHLIGHVEIRAALAAALRHGRLSESAYWKARASFIAEWAYCSLVQSDEPLILRAGELAEGFSLRGYDAVHLAAAERLFRALNEELVMLTYDEHLKRAASLLGIRITVHN